MSDYLFLVPISLLLGLIALAAFFWSLRSDQYDDLDGAAERVLVDEDRPLPLPGTEDGKGATARPEVGHAPTHDDERTAHP